MRPRRLPRARALPRSAQGLLPQSSPRRQARTQPTTIAPLRQVPTIAYPLRDARVPKAKATHPTRGEILRAAAAPPAPQRRELCRLRRDRRLRAGNLLRALPRHAIRRRRPVARPLKRDVPLRQRRAPASERSGAFLEDAPGGGGAYPRLGVRA